MCLWKNWLFIHANCALQELRFQNYVQMLTEQLEVILTCQLLQTLFLFLLLLLFSAVIKVRVNYLY